jgi:hypothetical protein
MTFLLDRTGLEAPCPRCGFFNGFTFRQGRLQDVIICRGCKANIFLRDHLGECRKAAHRIDEAISRLSRSPKR